MENNKNCCTNGKVTLVDPNLFDGFDSSNNISVPLEDLSIYVQLEVTKQARTYLNSDVKTNTNNSVSNESFNIKFIDGAKVNGVDYLTTNYTNLTSLDRDDSETEALGITSVDIDFNSSFAPMVVINFIDIRGSAIFQNENLKSKDNKNITNKYSVFFELPYPLFTLTVKGHYGLGVKYDLHMTKFNAKFNSSTGNFEITANFVGYTYAMLSDLLIGYLRAIPYTKIGASLYKKLSSENILTLDDLMIKISLIDSYIKKLKNTDEVKSLDNVQNCIDVLKNIKDELNNLGKQLSNNKDLPEYEYAISKTFPTDPNPNLYNQKIDLKSDALNNYNENAKQLVKKFNDYKLESIVLNETEFLSSNMTSYLDTVKPYLFVEEERLKLDKYIKDNGISDNEKIDIYDLSKQYNILKLKEQELVQIYENLKINLSVVLRDNFEKDLTFKPTIKNIINTFTSSVDVFMETLFNVSNAALVEKNREDELKKIFSNLDYKKDDGVYYPWPEYRKKENGFVEAYLGDVPNLTPSSINELVFIDDLFNAFITSQQKIDEALILEQKNNTTWFASSPLDTKFFTSKFPYDRLNGNSQSDVIALLMERAMIYIGYTNLKLTQKEIETFCENECNSIIRDIKNSKILQAVSQYTEDDFYKVKAINDNKIIPILKEYETTYHYNFIFVDNYKKVLPITIPGKGDFTFFFDDQPSNLTTLSDDFGYNFLTNYTTTPVYTKKGGTLTNNKPYDGGIYVKSISSEEYNKKIPNTINSDTNNVLNFASLTKGQKDFKDLKPEEIGFSINGGLYNTQEYKKVKYGVEGMDDAEYRTIFFADEITNNLANKLNNSLIYGKNDSEITKVKMLEGNLVVSDYEALINSKTEPKPLYGRNRYYLNNYISNIKDKISYPFISFQHKDSPSSPIGLFGSRLYNEQSSFQKDYAKAFLFLHTFPWAGLSNPVGGIFDANQILNTFNNRGGFISAPKLWAAFIGGLLWRNDTSEPSYSNGNIIIFGGSGSVDPITWYNLQYKEFIVPGLSNANPPPARNEYLTCLGSPMFFSSPYIKLDDILLQLPDQAKNEFKQIFFDFVKQPGQKSDWDVLKEYLEVFDGKSSDWVTTFSSVESLITQRKEIFKSDLNNYYSKKNGNEFVLNNYRAFVPFGGEMKYNFATELKPNTNAMTFLLDKISEEIYLVNTTWRIWQKEDTTIYSSETNSQIVVTKNDLSIFVKKAKEILNPDTIIKNISEEGKQDKISTFGTDNDNKIKLQLYKTCKNIYDKWIGGKSFYGQILTNDKTRLIDSFKFINRSFVDIGDELYINPTPVADFLKNNIDYSFYNVVTSLLSSNNLDFIALPTYIDYSDDKTLAQIFEPIPFNNFIETKTYGPSFVCMYIGQTSKNLSFNSSAYPNDGFDISCKNNNLEIKSSEDISVDDFAQKTDDTKKVAFFSVNYSQQNQNIFKDITLDQSEFSETDESLRIIDDIANRGSENRSSFGGQNMFDVYSVRSYKAEVEMMGDAMIQPMMYFQLNNIPMFHGAYMITRVKHSIKPNSMSTSFTGVRIRSIQTPLIDGYQMYMSLLDSLGLPTLSTTPGLNSASSAADRAPKTEIKCNTVTKNVNTFTDVLKLVVDNLEGSYYDGDFTKLTKQKDKDAFRNSGVTLWGLDRKNAGINWKTKKLYGKYKIFWEAVDAINKSKWTTSYPKPDDEPILFKTYSEAMKDRYDTDIKVLKPEVKRIVESDGRLYFNMIYAGINGSGYARGFGIMLNEAYNAGKTTSDELLKVFIDERVLGGYNAYEKGTPYTLDETAATLIANTGVDIQKMVGLGPYCTKSVA